MSDEEISLKMPLAEVIRDIRVKDIFYKRSTFGDLVCIVKVFHKDYKSPKRKPRRLYRPTRKALPAPKSRQLPYL